MPDMDLTLQIAHRHPDGINSVCHAIKGSLSDKWARQR
jgi:hypothetical protein